MCFSSFAEILFLVVICVCFRYAFAPFIVVVVVLRFIQFCNLIIFIMNHSVGL